MNCELEIWKWPGYLVSTCGQFYLSCWAYQKTENVTDKSRGAPENLVSLYVVIDNNIKQKGLFFSFFCFSFCCFASFTSLVLRSDKLLQCIFRHCLDFIFKIMRLFYYSIFNLKYLKYLISKYICTIVGILCTVTLPCNRTHFTNHIICALNR